MAVTIYHNPRCSKSRQTLALLLEAGLEPTVVEYLKDPPSASELSAILVKLGLEVRDLLRPGETAFAEAGLDDLELTDDEIIARMVAHPQVIQRPIVVSGDRAAIGRPPERVLEIL